MSLWVKTNWLVRWIFPKYVWSIPNNEKKVFLTFDDGPTPEITEWVLAELRNYNVKATFFCIGDNISKHPEVFEQIKANGHAIGNHTYNHLKGWKTDDKTYIDNFWQCQALTETNLFRPPYGRIKKSQMRKLVNSWQLTVGKKLKTENSELQTVMWDVLSGDFDLKLSPEKCYQNVIKNTRNGSIIVFHDSLKAWDRLEYALPKSIEYLLQQGYQFKTL